MTKNTIVVCATAAECEDRTFSQHGRNNPKTNHTTPRTDSPRSPQKIEECFSPVGFGRSRGYGTFNEQKPIAVKYYAAALLATASRLYNKQCQTARKTSNGSASIPYEVKGEYLSRTAMKRLSKKFAGVRGGAFVESVHNNHLCSSSTTTFMT